MSSELLDTVVKKTGQRDHKKYTRPVPGDHPHYQSETTHVERVVLARCGKYSLALTHLLLAEGGVGIPDARDATRRRQQQGTNKRQENDIFTVASCESTPTRAL